MLNSISGDGCYISVLTTTGHYYISNLGEDAGSLRLNPATQLIEVNDGVTWIPLNNQLTYVSITDRTKSILEWAEQKMAEEALLNSYAQSHPAINAALNNLREAETQLQVTMILASSETK
jgi:hypothetical protein